MEALFLRIFHEPFSLLRFTIEDFYKSSSPDVFLGRGVLKIYSKFIEHPCQNVISIKLQSNFIEITIRHGCSPVNLMYIFRTPFLKNSFGWLFLTFRNGSDLCMVLFLTFFPSLQVIKFRSNCVPPSTSRKFAPSPPPPKFNSSPPKVDPPPPLNNNFQAITQ